MTLKQSIIFSIALFLISGCSTTPTTRDTIPLSTQIIGVHRIMPVVGSRGMVVSDDEIASEWGASILRRGGNAMDAAVGTALVLGVTRPNFASIGGGGFLLYCPAKSKPNECQAIDFRETAPQSASRDSYIVQGKANNSLSQLGGKAWGTPGVVAGIFRAHHMAGTIPVSELSSEAVRVARNGFRVSAYLAYVLQNVWKDFNDEAKKLFSCGRKSGPCHAQDTLVQPELADTLEDVVENEGASFYQGALAERIVDFTKSQSGFLTRQDLASYKAEIRKPYEGRFKEHSLVTMSLPSGGGINLIQILSYLDIARKKHQLGQGFLSAKDLHVLSQAMSLSFADRAIEMGDPAFAQVPVEKLLSREYLENRWAKKFNPNGIIPAPKAKARGEPGATTHLSVIDEKGNAVAMTITLNGNFGAKAAVPGTGIVMNNVMDDFSLTPGQPNLYGLVGSEANSVVGGKRPLSSMVPTIVKDQAGNNKIVIGAQGGPMIPTSIAQVLYYRLEEGLSLMDAMAVPRLHHQWVPNEIKMEAHAFSTDTIERLKSKGHSISTIPFSAKVHALERFEDGSVEGTEDPRGSGRAVAE